MADKISTCPVKRYTGEIVLPEVLTMPQFIAWNQAVRDMTGKEGATMLEFHAALLPVILSIVKTWRLANIPDPLTFETFPATPAISSARLIEWLIGEIGKLINDEGEVPNESSATLTPMP